MKRIWHPFNLWEEVAAGMWSDTPGVDRSQLFSRCLELTGNASLFGQYMRRVASEWKFSCQHNLTDTGQNRIAWLGQAACALALQCPEHITRKVWGTLTCEQQRSADALAAGVILDWENAPENRRVSKQVGAPRVPARDTRRSPARAGSPQPRSLLSRHRAGHHAKRCSVDQPWLFPPEVCGVFHPQTNRNQGAQ